MSASTSASTSATETLPENPLVVGLERLPVPPTTLVIFGATGDLARRKLLPALYNLAHDGALPELFHLVGVSRREKPHEDYRAECAEAIRQFSRRTPDEDVLRGLLEHVKYVPGVFDEDSVYARLEKVLDRFERTAGQTLARLFYLSTAPAFFPVIVEALGRHGLGRREELAAGRSRGQEAGTEGSKSARAEASAGGAAGGAADAARGAGGGAGGAADGARDAADGARDAAERARDAAEGAKDAAEGAKDAAEGAKGAGGAAREDRHGQARVIIEKPFGTSLKEACDLNRQVLAVFDEAQVFRIDHYLGKETVQNLMAFRFANGMFEPLWNRNYIDSVQITAAEDLGIGGRAGYYDSAGALRDLIQNHMLQLLCHVAMEPPGRFTADEVRNEKVKVLKAIPAPTPADVEQIARRGQYRAGHVGGDDVVGYLEEEGVPPTSTTETFAALRLEVDNWRWAGVPFYLRAGKRLARKVTEIAVTLKPVPHLAFTQNGSLRIRPNQLVLTVQPNEGVSLQLGAKVPGSRMIIRPVNMEFLYDTSFLSQSPEAYERLIVDAMRGDATLFTRNDEVEAQWRICDPIVTAWQEMPGPLPQYEAGSQGPEQAREILLAGHDWRVI